MRLIVTAGFDRSIPAIALCELLKRSGHEIESVLVVTPFNLKRLKLILKKRGYSGLKKVVKKLFTTKKNNSNSNQSNFLSKNNISHISLRSWCKKNKTNYITLKNINSLTAINHLKTAVPDAVIYSGGGILNSSFIAAANQKIINNHSGPLPQIRGMNAVEWSILLGYKPAITIHKIDRGIDTGEIISKKNLSFNNNESIESIREIAVMEGVIELVRLLDGLEDINNLKTTKNESHNAGRQCFIMAPALKELLEKKLQGNHE